MARLSISWNETKTYEAEIEVDGYDENSKPSDLREAIAEQISPDDLPMFEQPDEDRGIEIMGHDVVREGDQPVKVLAAPSYTPDFEL